MQHPDPYGHQLQLLCVANLWHEDFSWYFYDYMSVYQFRRSLEETACFNEAMQSMYILYAHDCSYTYRIESLAPDQVRRQQASRMIPVYVDQTGRVQTVPAGELEANHVAYLRRGWCEAECQWSSLRSDSSHSVLLDSDLAQDFSRAPMPPQIFQSRVLTNQLEFTHREDSEPVKEMQESVYAAKCCACNLKLCTLRAEQVSILATALPDFRNLRQLFATRPS